MQCFFSYLLPPGFLYSRKHYKTRKWLGIGTLGTILRFRMNTRRLHGAEESNPLIFHAVKGEGDTRDIKVNMMMDRFSRGSVKGVVLD